MINQQMQAPGQSAGIASVLPPVQPKGGPSAGVNNWQSALEQMPIPQLLAEFMNPASNVPKFAVLSAIDQTKKKAAAMAAAQGMQAQNATAQQTGTVTDEVIAPLVQMARHGGAMHSYNRGGIVGFADGTPREGAQSYPVKDQEDVESLSVNERFARTIERLLGKKAEEGPRRWEEAQRDEAPDLMGESLVPTNEPDIGQAPNVAMLGKSGDPNVDIGPAQLRATPPPADTQAAPQVKPPPVAERPPAGLPGILDMDPYFKAERERLETAGRPSADVIKAREAYDELISGQAADRAAAAQRRAAGLKALEERAARAGDIDRSDLLLALGTSLLGAKTFSEGMGGAGQQLQGLRKAAAERTEKALERVERRQDLADQLAVKDAEVARAEQAELVARATGDDKAAREAAVAKNALLKQRFEIGVQLKGLDLKGRQVAATEMQAEAARTQAGRPTETQQMIDLFENNPELFKARYGDREEALMVQLRKSYDDYAVKLPLTATPITFAQYVAQFKEAGKKGPALGTPENPIKLD